MITERQRRRFENRLGLRLKRQRYHGPLRRRPKKGPRGVRAEAVNGAKLGLYQEEMDSHRDRIQRLQAEFENYRRRTRREMEQIKEIAKTGLLKNLLPVLDNFFRAIEHPATSFEGYIEGVRMIHTLMMNMLCEEGLEKIAARGESFDPNFHDAVAVDPSGEHPENQIVEVLQDGYLYKGKLIRPAVVRVARQG